MSSLSALANEHHLVGIIILLRWAYVYTHDESTTTVPRPPQTLVLALHDHHNSVLRSTYNTPVVGHPRLVEAGIVEGSGVDLSTLSWVLLQLVVEASRALT